MSRLDRWINRFTFGGRIAGGVGLVLVLIVATSLIAAFGDRHVGSLFEYGALVPNRVWHGQVWRLLTWGFIETGPLPLLFACLCLYWVGRDLAEEWGSRWFVLVYGGVQLVASIGTCVLALADRDVAGQHFTGSWPVVSAIVVAWGLWFPNREIRPWLLFSIRGAVIAWLTVGLTIVSAVYFGWERFAPALFAEGTVIAMLFRRSIAEQWSGWRLARTARTRTARHKARDEAARASSEAALSALETSDEELPPLPPEIEGALDRIVKQSGARPKRPRKNIA